MATLDLTNTELFAAGGYVELSSASQDNVAAHTLLFYGRPSGTGDSSFPYFWGKTPSGSINGPRFFVEHNSGSPRVAFGRGSNGGASAAPQRSGPNNSVVYDAWQHIAATWDGGVASSSINIFTATTGDLTEVGSYVTNTEGTGAPSDDSADNTFLANRKGLGRSFVGDYAYLARWNRVLSLAELRRAQSQGPLSVPNGLILIWANQGDLGPSEIAATGRSTFAAGATAPNTVLGTSPQGTTTIGAITPGQTTASVPYTYSLTGDALDASGFEARINGGTPFAVGSSPITLESLTPETAYDIEVRPVNAVDPGGWSTVSQFTTTSEPTIGLVVDQLVYTDKAKTALYSGAGLKITVLNRATPRAIVYQADGATITDGIVEIIDSAFETADEAFDVVIDDGGVVRGYLPAAVVSN